MTRAYNKCIVFDVSSYGLGHLGQVAPVIDALGRRYPETRIVVRTTYASSVVKSFIASNVHIELPPPEATLVMRSPIVVDKIKSAAAYRAIHEKWEDHLNFESVRLAKHEPAILVADVPYLSIAVAKRVGIPAVAMCCLNWLDLYRTYCDWHDDALDVIRVLKDVYTSADLFLQPRPHMPMLDIPNRRSIGPVARIGRQRKGELKTILGLSENKNVVLATAGGIREERAIYLPPMRDVHWLLGPGHSTLPGGGTRVSDIDMSFIDIMASSDAVLTKVGYGTFVEAACNGVGILSGERPDWPETAGLFAWGKQNANFAVIEGNIEKELGLRIALSTVLGGPRKSPVAASGVIDAAEIIAKMAEL